MDEICIFPVGNTLACQIAAEKLSQAGLLMVDHPRPEVTHLLLDVPSFSASGKLRGGGDVETLLAMLPEDLTVIGGKLIHPALEGYRKLDLLRDEGYTAQNAAITAHCALALAAPMLKTTFRDTPTLILGWGRIGKCLGQMLKALGSPVTVAARKDSDRGMLTALGYQAVDFDQVLTLNCPLVFNTVPQQIVSISWDCVKIDLASIRGLNEPDVIWARGLPGIHAPESTGTLMADTILRNLEAAK